MGLVLVRAYASLPMPMHPMMVIGTDRNIQAVMMMMVSCWCRWSSLSSRRRQVHPPLGFCCAKNHPGGDTTSSHAVVSREEWLSLDQHISPRSKLTSPIQLAQNINPEGSARWDVILHLFRSVQKCTSADTSWRAMTTTWLGSTSLAAPYIHYYANVAYLFTQVLPR